MHQTGLWCSRIFLAQPGHDRLQFWRIGSAASGSDQSSLRSALYITLGLTQVGQASQAV